MNEFILLLFRLQMPNKLIIERILKAYMSETNTTSVHSNRSLVSIVKYAALTINLQ